ncbi:hypothetical protein DFH11DRAFT_143459 [Phellopilus nigrolimitatus]|nr:hypothetical protein DFH11DRAFT_143459 [Phellopilus nigrolimitatus]
MCGRMANYLLSTDPQVLADAIRCIRRITFLDRYFWRSMMDALLAVSQQISGQEYVNISREAVESADLRRFFRALDFKGTSNNLFRHWSQRDGRMHIRPTTPFSPKLPCELCSAQGSWDLDDQSFSSEGHHPVLAGVNARGEREYVVQVHTMRTNGTSTQRVEHFCTVAEGAKDVIYVDRGKIKRSTKFEVMVLRFDPDADGLLDEIIAEVGYVDATGPCYWEQRKIKDVGTSIPRRVYF